MRIGLLSVLFLSGLLSSPALAVESQGHRGARGLLPENTLPGFARALSIGVNVLELDTGITADGVVVVGHDRRLSPAITRDADGNWLAKPTPLLKELTAAQLAAFDVGRIDPASRYARRFPDQQPLDGTHMPELRAVFDLVRRAGAGTVGFNIETKLHPEAAGDTVTPERFATLVVAEIRRAGLLERTTLQSFDWRTLQHAQRLAPGLRTAYLSAERRWLNNIRRGQAGASPWTAGFDIDAHASLPAMIKAAGGAIWSPYHRDLKDDDLRAAQSLGLEVIVWTVNDPDDMRALIARGVDGIITDYPDRLRTVLEDLGKLLPRAYPVTP